jgi:3-oxoacyl-[acyl-carrier-protein] synthase-3
MSAPTSVHTRIAGTGSALPERLVSNAVLVGELAERGIETSDDWIVERTGIRQRYLAAPEVTSSLLGARAAREALAAAGVAAGDVDLIVVATSTPDYVFPSTACLVQRELGIQGCAAFDVQAVCSGFVYALAVADAMIRTGAVNHALVIGAEVFSRILDWNDRGTQTDDTNRSCAPRATSPTDRSPAIRSSRWTARRSSGLR